MLSYIDLDEIINLVDKKHFYLAIKYIQRKLDIDFSSAINEFQKFI